jgi:hypothetical protein
MQIDIIITEYAGAPSDKAIHENGKFNRKILPTTNWYNFILPVASNADTIGKLIDSISASIKTSLVNNIE